MLLRLLSPSRQHLEPDEEELLQNSSDTSKKSDLTKRKEHLTFMKRTIITLFIKYAKDLVHFKFYFVYIKNIVKIINFFTVCFFQDLLSERFKGINRSCQSILSSRSYQNHSSLVR